MAKRSIKELRENLRKSFADQTKKQKSTWGVVLFIFVLLIIFNYANRSKNDDRKISDVIKGIAAPDSLPRISFENLSYYFDTISKGDTVQIEFVFKNKGRAPLVINEVMATCGCTAAFYTKDSIAMGEKGIVNVIFNSWNKEGNVDADVSVMSNATNNDVFLRIHGYVRYTKEFQ